MDFDYNIPSSMVINTNPGATGAYSEALSTPEGKLTTEFLWNPSLYYGTEGEAEIGDIGVLVNGGFHRIWNITLPFFAGATSPVNRNAPPPGFSPPLFNASEDVVTEHATLRSEEAKCSKGVTYLGYEKDPDYPKARLYKFSAKDSVRSGAVMVSLADADHFYVKEHIRKQWSTLVDANYKTWRTYDDCRNFSIDDLVLVTGCIKTKGYVSAVFTGCGEFAVRILRNFDRGGFFMRSESNSGQVWSRRTVEEEPDVGQPAMNVFSTPNHPVILEVRRFVKKERKALRTRPPSPDSHRSMITWNDSSFIRPKEEKDGLWNLAHHVPTRKYTSQGSSIGYAQSITSDDGSETLAGDSIRGDD